MVVVFPEPAPARMHTGPRNVSTARSCSGFKPAVIGPLIVLGATYSHRDSLPTSRARAPREPRRTCGAEACSLPWKGFPRRKLGTLLWVESLDIDDQA